MAEKTEQDGEQPCKHVKMRNHWALAILRKKWQKVVVPIFSYCTAGVTVTLYTFSRTYFSNFIAMLTLFSLSNEWSA